jgi:ABC-type dipeptide/oligopeptide/nickel transport system ATPase component
MNKKRKSEIILSAKNINTGFISGNSFVSINKDISFDLYSGQILVIIGESGSGKSVLSKSFGGMNDESFFFSSGSLKYFKDKKPIELVDIFNSSNSGYYSKKMKKIYKNKLNKLSEEINVKNQDKNQNIVELNFLKNDYLQLNNEYINFGKTTKKYSKHDASKLIRKIRGKEISYVFQDPALALNPLLTVGQQITEVLKIHRNLKGKEAYNEAINLLQKVGIINPEKAIKMLPSEYSGGMRQRIVIAIALASNPKILIADEPTTALDVTIQKQIIQLLLNLKRELNIAIIFITHDLGVVAEIANSICVMYNGTFIEKGTKKDIFLNPKHPYT